ncbi:RNA-binding domain-containing protein [Schizopora paradoxa]|uniref:RNA-binding domain-containing protein n=1 Tax=Schizopora paradoxa TaxID=27342 RepID=A0A0H2S9J7_9AGAM|nr:RNA-binding domain-containing protein [Schizopora paradoxa]
MEEGTRAKRTVFIGGINDDIDEEAILEQFQVFGTVLEVQIPPAQVPHNNYQNANQSGPKHRGFAFVTYESASDAQDAIDNMDLNELKSRVIRVSLARPQKTPMAGLGNRAVWESEDWLAHHTKPLAESGGVGARAAIRAQGNAIAEESKEEEANGDDAMEE